MGKNSNFFLMETCLIEKLLIFAADKRCPQGSIGNRVQIPNSSRCCKLFTLAIMPLKTILFGKAVR